MIQINSNNPMMPLKKDKQFYPIGGAHKNEMLKMYKNAEKGIGIKAGDKPKKEELKNACNSFEAFFFNLMMSEMRKMSKKSNFLGEKSFANDVFSSMMDTEVAESVAKLGQLGISESMYKQLATQEGKK